MMAMAMSRVTVMSARPGTICAEFEVPFGRPRDHTIRGNPAFAALYEQIWEVLRVEANKLLQPAGAS